MMYLLTAFCSWRLQYYVCVKFHIGCILFFLVLIHLFAFSFRELELINVLLSNIENWNSNKLYDYKMFIYPLLMELESWMFICKFLHRKEGLGN